MYVCKTTSILVITLLFLSACNLKTTLETLTAKAPDCVVENEIISNSPCVIKDLDGKFLSETKYTGRSALMQNATLSATTNINYSSAGVIDSIEVTTNVPEGWSTNQSVMTLDRSLTQQGNAYNPDYLAENIVSGIDIFGLTGTYVIAQKPVCSNINTILPSSAVTGIDDPVNPAERKCVAPKGAFIYSAAFNGRSANCDLLGSANSTSCYVSQTSQTLYLVNADTQPLSCNYNYASNIFTNAVSNSIDFGKLKDAPTINSIRRDTCQVGSGEYFYPEAYGGRANKCATIAVPPCWLDIPAGQTRTVSLSTGSNTNVCLENQVDNSTTTTEPSSKNNIGQCLTAGTNRYVYTSAFDGRFKDCNTDSLGKCYHNTSDLHNYSVVFVNSDNAICRSDLNTCINNAGTALNTCDGATSNAIICSKNYSDSYHSCYDTYKTCMITVKNCEANKTSCLAACAGNTSCQATCNNNYNNCTLVENPKAGVWYLNAGLKVTNPATNKLIIPSGNYKSASIPYSQILHANAIKAGINIFGVTGSYGGEGVWGSGIHRDKSVPQLTLNQENTTYAGAPLPASLPGYYDSAKPYREIPSIIKDDDGSAVDSNIIPTPDRTLWGTTNCGTSATSVDLKISDCGTKFGADARWDGGSNGNASQGAWTLVARKLDSSTGNMVEVWKDERTGMLWSSLISEATNWCKASGSSNNPGVAVRYTEADPSSICDQGAYQNQLGSVISACMEDTGFSRVDSTLNMNGTADLSMASTPKIRWRIPTLYDYEIAEYNGIRFVMPDMGPQRSMYLNEWTGTVSSLNRVQAWVFGSIDGTHKLVNRTDNAGVRCIGR